MKLNNTFNNDIESLIKSSKTLSNWFENNQDSMEQYELLNPACLNYDNIFTNFDIHILGSMAKACLKWLQTPYNYTDEEKIQNATEEMSNIYNLNEKVLSTAARELYAINVVELEEKRTRSKRL